MVSLCFKFCNFLVLPCRDLQPICAVSIGVCATPASALMTETRAGDVVRVPGHPTLEYVGIDKVVLRSQEDPAWPPMTAATVTEDSMDMWMERYIKPMLLDMVRLGSQHDFAFVLFSSIQQDGVLLVRNHIRGLLSAQSWLDRGAVRISTAQGWPKCFLL